MLDDNDKADDEADDASATGDEYSLMLALERLESLREDLDELGYGSLQEVEGALTMTANGAQPGGNGVYNNSAVVVGNVDREHLRTIRNDMIDLGVANLDEITGAINDLNTRLDALDDGKE